MATRVVIDDIAALTASSNFAAGPDSAFEVSQLRSPADVEGVLSAGFAENNGPAVVVTADARLGAMITGARRIADTGLLATLAADSDARFQFFALWTPQDQLTANAATLAVDAVVPVHRALTPAGDTTLIVGIAENGVLQQFAASGWTVATIGAPNLPDTHDVYLMRDARAAGSPENVERFDRLGAQVVLSSDEGLFVAIPHQISIEALHLPVTGHGHNLKLLPNRTLLRVEEPAPESAVLGAELEPARHVAEQLSSLIAASEVKQLVARLSGDAAVGGSPIASRHVHHPDASRAVELVSEEFDALGLQPNKHFFVHEGRVLANVFADITGTGDEMIWVTAHLDSTAGRGEPAYEPASDPAPGADDDASGTAAVIAIAAALKALAATAPPRRSIRFALFNAEEHGLVGSGFFASAAAAAGLRIHGVLQHDMIGHVPAGGDRRFEVHCGHRADAAVEARSEPLATLIAACAALFGELDPAEIYRTPDDGVGEDPADGRSDHSSFQSRGFPAVIVSENFFGGTVEQPTAEPTNPNYHRATDTAVDAAFARSIAQATALAAWTLATA